MTRSIHPTAIVHEAAVLGENVEIGPYCTVGESVKIGDNTVLKSHVVVEGNTEIGQGNVIFPFAVVGVVPQDLKFAGENSRLIIGDNNVIREHATLHLGTKDGAMETRVGSNCLLMVGVHIAHDCVVGNHVILANNATLAGHVQVADHVVIGGLSAVHQFVRIGKNAMIGGMSGVEADVLPYATVMGERATLAGLNLIGMRRAGIERPDIHALRGFFKQLFNRDEDVSFLERVEEVAQGVENRTVREVVSFIRDETSRSFCQPKNML